MNKEKFELLAKELQFLHYDNSDEASEKRAHTSHPIFYVQEMTPVCAVYASDEGEIINPFEHGEIRTEYHNPSLAETYSSLDELREVYESLGEFNEALEGVEEYECLYMYTDVCAHLTREAAQLYIDQNRHNLREPRIYVKSMYRCHEMIGLITAIANGFLVWRE